MAILTKRFTADFAQEHPEFLLEMAERFLENQVAGQAEVLRWAIVGARGRKKIIEAAVIEAKSIPKDNPPKLRKSLLFGLSPGFTILQIVPTGVKAEVGGYIGDATPATNLLAAASDWVITHPNVLNGALLNLAKPNVLYVEGYFLDLFCRGKISLARVLGNKIGVILDLGAKEKDESSLDITLNTINAMRAVGGVETVDVLITEEPVGGRALRMKSGTMAGLIENPEAFLSPARKLIERGANAIAIATHIEVSFDDLDAYFQGRIPNPYGGTEAIISHTISKFFGVPCAHAPILTCQEKERIVSRGVVDARAAGEAISAGYLGSVLQGLRFAPQIVEFELPGSNPFNFSCVKAVVAPASCLGGIPVLAAEHHGIPVIAVKENRTVLSVTASKLGLRNVIEVQNYPEAAGEILRIKEGLSYESVRRPLKKEVG